MRKIFLMLLIASSIQAQTGFEILRGGAYSPAIPTPHSILGYNVGDRFTEHSAINAYFEKLAAVSDRARRVIYGVTSERRILQALIVSNPENIARLDQIKKDNLALTDPRGFRSRDESSRILSSLPVIVYLSYGVHGNEASSPEAAMLLAYQLCAGDDQGTLTILQNTIVVIDPNVNPDGHERYVQWANSAATREPNLSPSSYEHSEPWPGGRTNHYFFDLNRDVSWQTQTETRARVRFYREWMPHVHVDYHEMDYASTYFFFPAAVPVHKALPPEAVKWGKIFGQGNAEAFDTLHIPYYVGERFDMFYPGYGDSWPTFNGAVGMTYEQAGGSRAGLAVRKPNGEVLTLRDRVSNHFITSLSTLETAVKHRRERLDDFYKFWDSAVRSSSLVKGYLIDNQPDPTRSSAVIETLLRQGIEVFQLVESASLLAQEYYSDKWLTQKVPKGTYFIPLSQPQSRLAQTLLEPMAAVSDTFFYDVSAWSLPVASGIRSWMTQSPLPSGAVRITSVAHVPGQIVGGSVKAFAYLIPWERNAAIPLVWQMLEKGYNLFVSRRPFDVVGRHFTAGTVIAFGNPNADSTRIDLSKLAEKFGVDIYATTTGLTEQGISLGSGHVVPIKKPEIAIAV